MESIINIEYCENIATLKEYKPHLVCTECNNILIFPIMCTECGYYYCIKCKNNCCTKGTMIMGSTLNGKGSIEKE